MADVTFTDLLLYFIAYSIIGWICEVIYCSVGAKRIVKRGFLAGPYCPIYGFGAITLLLALHPFASHISSIPLLFFISCIITSLLEYFTGWLMEKMFNMRWWDYSHYRFQLHGRVCLINSLLFGMMGILLLYYLHPQLSSLIFAIPSQFKSAIASLLLAGMLIDLITTLNGIYHLNAKLKEIHDTLTILRTYDEVYAWWDGKQIYKSLEQLHDIAAEVQDKRVLQLTERLTELILKDSAGLRLLSSFSHITSRETQEHLEIIKQGFQEKRKKLHAQLALKKKMQEASLNDDSLNTVSFAAGFNFYKMTWVFFIACIVGYVAESAFCIVTRGHLESRQGMIYGPFSQVYGIGAIIMVWILHKLVKKGDIWVFFGSAFIGGFYEAAFSFIQEILFKTVSWDYSEHSISFFNGRTSLSYMFFWGILGVLFMREIYPRMSRFVERIPNRQGIFITWIIVIFLSLDLIISAAAVMRWSQRNSGLPASSHVGTLLDAWYPDDFLAEIYPNMEFRSEVFRK